MALLELSLRNIAYAKNRRPQCFLLELVSSIDLIGESMMPCDTSNMKLGFEVWFGLLMTR